MSNELEYQVERVEAANSVLVGKKIKQVRYASQEELEDMMWDDDLFVVELEDGTLLFPSRDHEGNGPGVMFVQEPPSKEQSTFHQF